MALMCSGEDNCFNWVETNLRHYVSSSRDRVSLTLGVISVVSWCVAEIPQIITSYKAKSADGLSVAFLTTWMIGDIFNLAGCMLEPATLPTQYYTALLYTVTTTILGSQSIYYSHIYPRLRYWKSQKASKHDLTEANRKVKQRNSDVGVKQADSWNNGTVLSSPIPFPMSNQNDSPGRELYYRSARSLTSSYTPTAGAILARKMTAPTLSDWSSIEEPLLYGLNDTRSATPSTTKTMLCLVSVITLISTFNLHNSANKELGTVFKTGNQGFVTQVTRKLLQVSGGILHENVVEQSIGIATFLGWAMAAIYMGGRLPQIWLNIRRGNVEGLNPLMFVFALVGNIAYVASILVSSMKWSKISPNLPWLVDAGGCVLLDILILIQFAYFRHGSSLDSKEKHDKFEVA